MKATVLVFALALAACSGGSGTGKLNLSTHVTTAAVAGATAAPTAALAIGDHVTLDRARFLIRKVALEAAETGTDGSGTNDAGNGATLTATAATGTATTASAEGASDDPSDDAGDLVVRAGPLVIDLSGTQLQGGVALLFDQSVPAGTYDELEFQIHKLTPGESVADTDFLPLGNSIILDLTVDGTPFRFTSDLTAVSESEGPIVVPEGGTTNVTVTVDPSGWFTGPGGFLDPRVEANRSQIEQNIRSSIRGFEDEDRDGAPDPT